MALQITPERGVPIKDVPPPKDLTGKAEAAAETAKHLHAHGLEIDITAEDRGNASEISMAYAADPVRTSKKATLKNISRTPPATLLLTDKILKDFGHSVVQSATQVRHLVTNKLIEETENPDPRVRIRALELLGKISDVGLFAEKSEVTVTHQSTDDLREKLRAKLNKLVKVEDDRDKDPVIIDGESFDIDKELGLKDE